MASLVVGTPWMRLSGRISGAAPPIFRQSSPPSSPLLLYYHPNNYSGYNNICRCLSISSASSSSTVKDDVVRVRFAPSPTGNLHVGGARTALFNYLFARSKGGKFVLRIEDTDLERSTKESEEAMLQDLSWLGLNWDEGPGVGGDYGPYRQSERNALYKQYAEKLLKSGHVYRCFCSNEELEKMKEIAKLKQLPPVYNGKWASATGKEVEEELTKGTPFTYRFRVPKEGSLKIDDLIRGEVYWNLDTLGDFVIMRSNGQPVYNFCVTVDDATMAISHVIRAEEHLPNTLRQALIYKALGFPMPYFAHVSLILAPDRSKLSKRHGATSVGQFREIGYLPQAMVNYLALLGWGDGTENEFFTLEQLVEKFSIERVNKSGAVFDSTKFRWMNGQHLRLLPSEEFTRLIGRHWKSTGILSESEGLFIEEAVQLLKDGVADEVMKSETLTPNMEQNKASVEATIESNALGGTESSCNNNNGETSGITSDAEHEKSLEYAEELMVRGSKADKEHDYAEATDCYSRALEIRASHYGELALECVNAYYKYGCALLYKAQDEADILGSVPKKEDKSQEDSAKDESVKSVKSAESSTASVDTEENGSSNHQEETPNDDDGGNDGGDADDESDTEDLAEADEDESDLDLAWKMLDVARAIVEKHPDDTMEKVDILSALAEVALEREDIESSTSDYLKALSILERLVEPDSRHIASLNFRICLCLEIGSKAQEAIPYCQKAMSVCKSRVQRLMDEAKSSTASVSVESDQNVQLSSSTLVDSAAVKDEIETLTGLLGDLERKLEDLQQLVSNPPTPILADILGMVTAKAKGHEKGAYSTFMSSSQMGLASTGNQDSPTISTAHTNGTGVTHLGVVGRGVKRVLMNSGSTESNPMKKPAIDPPADKGDGKAS